MALARGNARLSVEDAMLVKQLLAEGLRDSEIGRKFDVHHSTIRAVRIGKTWKHVRGPSERVHVCEVCGRESLPADMLAKLQRRVSVESSGYRGDRRLLSLLLQWHMGHPGS